MKELIILLISLIVLIIFISFILALYYANKNNSKTSQFSGGVLTNATGRSCGISAITNLYEALIRPNFQYSMSVNKRNDYNLDTSRFLYTNELTGTIIEVTRGKNGEELTKDIGTNHLIHEMFYIYNRHNFKVYKDLTMLTSIENQPNSLEKYIKSPICGMVFRLYNSEHYISVVILEYDNFIVMNDGHCDIMNKERFYDMYLTSSNIWLIFSVNKIMPKYDNAKMLQLFIYIISDIVKYTYKTSKFDIEIKLMVNETDMRNMKKAEVSNYKELFNTRVIGDFLQVFSYNIKHNNNNNIISGKVVKNVDEYCYYNDTVSENNNIIDRIIKNIHKLYYKLKLYNDTLSMLLYDDKDNEETNKLFDKLVLFAYTPRPDVLINEYNHDISYELSHTAHNKELFTAMSLNKKLIEVPKQEVPKPAETSKPIEVPKPVETSKPVEVPKPVETSKKSSEYESFLNSDRILKRERLQQKIILDDINNFTYNSKYVESDKLAQNLRKLDLVQNLPSNRTQHQPNIQDTTYEDYDFF